MNRLWTYIGHNPLGDRRLDLWLRNVTKFLKKDPSTVNRQDQN